mmetsp:Transcript_129795/g.416490  ORF Transcript_129795/g.416490 Transcript_129795/m.416490 type:complete len:346 (+) Transcript_129795:106-1143(+)
MPAPLQTPSGRRGAVLRSSWVGTRWAADWRSRRRSGTRRNCASRCASAGRGRRPPQPLSCRRRARRRGGSSLGRPLHPPLCKAAPQVAHRAPAWCASQATAAAALLAASAALGAATAMVAAPTTAALAAVSAVATAAAATAAEAAAMAAAPTAVAPAAAADAALAAAPALVAAVAALAARTASALALAALAAAAAQLHRPLLEAPPARRRVCGERLRCLSSRRASKCGGRQRAGSARPRPRRTAPRPSPPSAGRCSPSFPRSMPWPIRWRSCRTSCGPGSRPSRTSRSRGGLTSSARWPTRPLPSELLATSPCCGSWTTASRACARSSATSLRAVPKNCGPSCRI